MQHLSAFGVPCGAVLDTAELLANEHLRACGMIVDHTHPQWGDLRVPGCPIRLDDFTPRLDPAPAAGQHTDEVLDELVRREPVCRCAEECAGSGLGGGRGTCAVDTRTRPPSARHTSTSEETRCPRTLMAPAAARSPASSSPT